MSRSRRLVLICALFAAVFAAPSFARAYPMNSYALFPPGGYEGCQLCHGGRSNDVKGPHAGFASTTAVCRTCHWSTHDAYGPKLLFQSSTTVVCRACHDGTGSRGIYRFASAGLTPGASHRVETTNVVPGGAADGGNATTTFSGTGGTLGCEDCHSPHGSRTIEPFEHAKPRLHDGTGKHDLLLRSKPTGADTTVTVYGSDWCLACHRGRASGGTLHNHPVDSKLARTDPFTHDNVLIGSPIVPSPLAVSPDGSSVYVADVGNRRVSQFTTAGAPVRRWTVNTNGVLSGLTFTGDKNGDGQRDLMTCDRMQGIEVNPYGDGVRWWKQDGTPVFHDTFMVNPMTAVADNRAGTLPTGLRDALIQNITNLTWNAYGSLSSASGGAITSGGRLFVTDKAWNRVAVYDRLAGGIPFLFAFPPGAPASAGAGNGEFRAPQAVAVSPTDVIYVADTGNDRVQYFDASGTYLGKWGSSGSGPGQFGSPTGVAVANDGTVYVADRYERVQVFSSTGTFLRQFGSRGDGPGELSLQSAVMGPLDPYNHETFLMADPRLVLQEGHGPICQQCHEDSREAGDLVDGVPAPAMWRGWPNPPLVKYFCFPHETENRRMLIENDDDLCLNCHASGTLP